MIELVSIKKTYRSSDGPVTAISDLTFSIPSGQFASIIGPSGCGKSTLLKMIGGLVDPSGGQILVDGRPLPTVPTQGKFSFVFQNPVMLPWRTVLENVELPQQILGRHNRDAAALLEIVGLKGFENKYPDELSGGMQQRAAIARALTFDPDVLLMDEPFGAVDELTRGELNFELLKLWKSIDVTLLFVTHSIEEAVFLSDRVIVLSERPAVLAADIEIPFERPRSRDIKEHPEFQEIVKCLREHLS